MNINYRPVRYLSRLALILLGLVALLGCKSPSTAQNPTFEFVEEKAEDYLGRPRAWLRIDPHGEIMTDIRVNWGIGNVETISELVPYAESPLYELNGEIWRDTQNQPYFSTHPTSEVLPGHINEPVRVMLSWGDLPDPLGSQSKLVYRVRVTLATTEGDMFKFSQLRTITHEESSDPSVTISPPVGGPSGCQVGPALTPPVIIMPTTGQTCVGTLSGNIVNVPFDFQDVANVTEYQIEIKKTGVSSCVSGYDGTLGGTGSGGSSNGGQADCWIPDLNSSFHADLLAPSTEYEWRARGSYCQGDEQFQPGPWSPFTSFKTVGPLDPLTLLKPANGETLPNPLGAAQITVLFSWKQTDCPVPTYHYKIIRLADNFVFKTGSTSSTSMSLLIPAGGPYEWRLWVEASQYGSTPVASRTFSVAK